MSDCCSFQIGPTGKAVGVEHIKELVHESIRNVQEDDPTLLSSGRVKLVGELPAIPGLVPWLCSTKSFQSVLML